MALHATQQVSPNLQCYLYSVPSDIERYTAIHFLHPVAKLFPGAYFPSLSLMYWKS